MVSSSIWAHTEESRISKISLELKVALENFYLDFLETISTQRHYDVRFDVMISHKNSFPHATTLMLRTLLGISCNAFHAKTLFKVF